MRIVAGWQRWEHLVGHHDELTDIGSLGELLVALLCGLDLADEGDAALLQQRRDNLFALAPALHPVLATVASSMIAPDRRRRAQDLADVIARLETYRDQPEDFDLERVLGGRTDARAAVLEHLRDRLFDASRRNPLLHFRPTGRTLNLTEASVPLVLDVRTSGRRSCSRGAARRPRGWWTARRSTSARWCAGTTPPTPRRRSTRSSRRPAATVPSTGTTSCGSSSRSCAGTT